MKAKLESMSLLGPEFEDESSDESSNESGSESDYVGFNSFYEEYVSKEFYSQPDVTAYVEEAD